MIDKPTTSTVKTHALLRERRVIGYVRSLAVFRRLQRHLAGTVELDDHRATGELTVYVLGYKDGQKFTRTMLRAQSWAEAMLKLERLKREPGDLVQIDDDVGTLAHLPLEEFHANPTLDRLAADGAGALTLRCDRCKRRTRCTIEALLERFGGATTIDAVTEQWAARCGERRGGPYRRCVLRADLRHQ